LFGKGEDHAEDAGQQGLVAAIGIEDVGGASAGEHEQAEGGRLEEGPAQARYGDAVDVYGLPKKIGGEIARKRIGESKTDRAKDHEEKSEQ